MPLYEFRCANCGEFETWQTLAEVGTPVACPQCQNQSEKIFSPPNINLNSRGLSLRRGESKEPKLVKSDRQPSSPRYKQSRCNRPWMIGHG